MHPFNQRIAQLALVLPVAACASPIVTKDRADYAPIAPFGWQPRAEPYNSEPNAGTTAPHLDADLGTWIAYALRVHPSVIAADERWQAARARISGASAWPDPVVRARYFAEPVETRVGSQRYSLGISQTIPWYTRSDAITDDATRRAAAEHAHTFSAAAQVRMEIKLTWCELYYTERALEVLRENHELLARLGEVVRTQYAAGAAGYAATIRAQVELDRSADKLKSLADRRQPLGTRWRSAIHLEAGRPVPTPESLDSGGSLASDSELSRRALEANPELGALRMSLAVAQGEIALADVSNRPDVTFGLDYIATDQRPTAGVEGNGDDPIILSFSIPIPMRSLRVDAQRRAARSSARAMTAELSAASDRLAHALGEEFYRLRESERRMQLYRSALVPKAEQTLEATETAFRAGSTGFFELVDAQQTLLEFKLTIARAETDRAIAVARLERLVGGPVQDNTAQAEESR